MLSDGARDGRDIKPCTRASRNVWFLSANFLLLAGGFLYLLPERSEMYFPFYISNPNTAVFLGANYLASAALDLNSWRQRVWANGRIAAPSALLFATLIGLLGAENLQYYRFEWPVLVASIFWFVIYWGVPVLVAVTLYFQAKLPGVDPTRAAPLPSWMRAVFLVGGVSMFSLGVWLYATTPAPQYQSDMAGPPRAHGGAPSGSVNSRESSAPTASAPSGEVSSPAARASARGGAPSASPIVGAPVQSGGSSPGVAGGGAPPSPTAGHPRAGAPSRSPAAPAEAAWHPPIEPLSSSALWPWDLTSSVLGSKYPISLQAYVGVWVLVFGFIVLHGWWENDLVRIRPMLWGAAVGSSLQIIAVIRYPFENMWEPVGLVYLAVHAATLGIAVVGLKLGATSRAEDWYHDHG